MTHTRVCEKYGVRGQKLRGSQSKVTGPKSASLTLNTRFCQKPDVVRQKRHQRDCPTVLFLTRVHEFHSYTNAPSRTAAKLTRRGDSIFQGLRPTKNHTENAIGASSWSWICATNWEWDHDNLSDGFAKSRRVEVLTVSKPRKCDSLFAARRLSSATSKQRQRQQKPPS